MKWLTNLFREVVDPPRWRIVHDHELGYCAQERDSIGWSAIDHHGMLSVYNDSAQAFPHLWCKTEAEAGGRINMRAKTEGRRVVWTGN